MTIPVCSAFTAIAGFVWMWLGALDGRLDLTICGALLWLVSIAWLITWVWAQPEEEG